MSASIFSGRLSIVTLIEIFLPDLHSKKCMVKISTETGILSVWDGLEVLRVEQMLSILMSSNAGEFLDIHATV